MFFRARMRGKIPKSGKLCRITADALPQGEFCKMVSGLPRAKPPEVLPRFLKGLGLIVESFFLRSMPSPEMHGFAGGIGAARGAAPVDGRRPDAFLKSPPGFVRYKNARRGILTAPSSLSRPARGGGACFSGAGRGSGLGLKGARSPAYFKKIRKAFFIWQRRY